jgi:hypothetical protein
LVYVSMGHRFASALTCSTVYVVFGGYNVK